MSRHLRQTPMNVISPAYHDLRESEEESFDWFKSYTDVADILRGLIPNKNSRILMLGCGNSKLSEDVRTGFFTIRASLQTMRIRCTTTAIRILSTSMCVSGVRGGRNRSPDARFERQYSPVVIEKMKHKHSEIRPEMECTTSFIRVAPDLFK